MVLFAPAPINITDLFKVTTEFQLQDPLGTLTLFPAIAASMAACTSACEQLAALTVAASAVCICISQLKNKKLAQNKTATVLHIKLKTRRVSFALSLSLSLSALKILDILFGF